MSLQIHITLRPELKPSHPNERRRVVLPENMGPTITIRQPFPISMELGNDVAYLISYMISKLYTTSLTSKGEY